MHGRTGSAGTVPRRVTKPAAEPGSNSPAHASAAFARSITGPAPRNACRAAFTDVRYVNVFTNAVRGGFLLHCRQGGVLRFQRTAQGACATAAVAWCGNTDQHLWVRGSASRKGCAIQGCFLLVSTEPFGSSGVALSVRWRHVIAAHRRRRTTTNLQRQGGAMNESRCSTRTPSAIRAARGHGHDGALTGFGRGIHSELES